MYSFIFVFIICVGFLTLQTQRRHAKTLKGEKEFPSRVVSCHKNVDSSKNFSSSCEKSKTQEKILAQTLGATSDGEAIVQPNNDFEVTWQNTLRRKWDAFSIFSRPYSAICTVSTSLYRSFTYLNEQITNDLNNLHVLA